MHKRYYRARMFEYGTPPNCGRALPGSPILQNFDNEMHFQCVKTVSKLLSNPEANSNPEQGNDKFSQGEAMSKSYKSAKR